MIKLVLNLGGLAIRMDASHLLLQASRSVGKNFLYGSIVVLHKVSYYIKVQGKWYISIEPSIKLR